MDFFKTEIPKEAKIRNLKQKGKGVGKKSNRQPDSSMTDRNSAQERVPSATRVIAQEQEVLEIEITKDKSENLCAENNNKPKAGPSGQRKKRSREKETKNDKERTTKSDEKSERKRQCSPKRERIKFFQEKGTPNAKLAEQVDVDRQLLVYGLPESRFQWRDRERALNKLVTNLSSEEIGDQGITLEQKHIIGAYHTSNKDKQMITRLTVDTKETKENIRRAALQAKRWGVAGRHTVFLRDTLPENPAQKRGRSSSNEDTKTPKKRRTEDEETPRSSRSNKEKGHPRSRPEGRPEETQTKMTTESEELEKIRLERLEARRAKIEHQEKEDRATQELINKQGK